MGTPTIAILLSSQAWCCGRVFNGGRLPKSFSIRTCEGKHPCNAFPYSSKQDIREFLPVFGDAFALSQKEWEIRGQRLFYLKGLRPLTLRALAAAPAVGAPIGKP